MTRRRPDETGPRRGQTLVDFAVGIAVVLVTLSFIVVFLPQLTLPYDDTEQPVVAERAGSTLDHHITAQGSESKLNETCTTAFFDLGPDTGCQFDSGDPVTEKLGIDSSYSVNVTLRNVASDTSNSTLLCADNGSIDGCGDGGEQLAEGPTVPDEEVSVTTVRRSVFTAERNAVLELVVW